MDPHNSPLKQNYIEKAIALISFVLVVPTIHAKMILSGIIQEDSTLDITCIYQMDISIVCFHLGISQMTEGYFF